MPSRKDTGMSRHETKLPKVGAYYIATLKSHCMGHTVERNDVLYVRKIRNEQSGIKVVCSLNYDTEILPPMPVDNFFSFTKKTNEHSECVNTGKVYKVKKPLDVVWAGAGVVKSIAEPGLYRVICKGIGKFKDKIIIEDYKNAFVIRRFLLWECYFHSNAVFQEFVPLKVVASDDEKPEECEEEKTVSVSIEKITLPNISDGCQVKKINRSSSESYPENATTKVDQYVFMLAKDIKAYDFVITHHDKREKAQIHFNGDYITMLKGAEIAIPNIKAVKVSNVLCVLVKTQPTGAEWYAKLDELKDAFVGSNFDERHSNAIQAGTIYVSMTKLNLMCTNGGYGVVAHKGTKFYVKKVTGHTVIMKDISKKYGDEVLGSVEYLKGKMRAANKELRQLLNL